MRETSSAAHGNPPTPPPHASAPTPAIEWNVDTPQPGERAASPRELLVQGWMFSHDGTPLHGVVRIAEMPDVAFTQTVVRTDVVEHFRGRHEVPGKCGFSVRVSLPADNSAKVELSIAVALEGSADFTVPITRAITRAVALPWPARRFRTTVISHFYNEEYLLPLWLRHHLPLFDHGILINRGSTDRSVAICRELAPHWEVRDATRLDFDAEDADLEVMAIEREVTGWKFVLNTTELLHVHSKESFIQALHLWGGVAYGIGMACLIDPEGVAYPEFDVGRPVAAQRHHGRLLPPVSAYRYIHRCPDGDYTVGRHSTRHPASIIPLEAAVLLKLMYSPWNKTFKRRKLQIHATLSQKSISRGEGVQHVATEEELEHDRRARLIHAKDLHEQAALQWVFAPTSRIAAR